LPLAKIDFLLGDPAIETVASATPTSSATSRGRRPPDQHNSITRRRNSGEYDFGMNLSFRENNATHPLTNTVHYSGTRPLAETGAHRQDEIIRWFPAEPEQAAAALSLAIGQRAVVRVSGKNDADITARWAVVEAMARQAMAEASAESN
jgi:hypothetical protein